MRDTVSSETDAGGRAFTKGLAQLPRSNVCLELTCGRRRGGKVGELRNSLRLHFAMIKSWLMLWVGRFRCHGDSLSRSRVVFLSISSVQVLRWEYGLCIFRNSCGRLWVRKVDDVLIIATAAVVDGRGVGHSLRRVAERGTAIYRTWGAPVFHDDNSSGRSFNSWWYGRKKGREEMSR